MQFYDNFLVSCCVARGHYVFRGLTTTGAHNDSQVVTSSYQDKSVSYCISCFRDFLPIMLEMLLKTLTFRLCDVISKVLFVVCVHGVVMLYKMGNIGKILGDCQIQEFDRQMNRPENIVRTRGTIRALISKFHSMVSDVRSHKGKKKRKVKGGGVFI